MKIYHLIIAYNDKTEEIEYIQEEIEDDEAIDPGLSQAISFYLERDEAHQFDDEVLLRLIDEFGIGEA